MPRRLRFSLQTLMLGVLFFGSAGLLWKHWEAWRVALKLPEHQAPIKSAQFSPDGTRVLTITDFDRKYDEAQSRKGAADNQVSVFDSATGERLFVKNGSSPTMDFLPATAWFSPGGKWVMAGIDYTRMNRRWDPWIKAWRVDNGEELRIPIGTDHLSLLAASPDDRWIVLEKQSGLTLRAFDTVELRSSTLSTKLELMDAGQFSPDGKLFAAVAQVAEGNNLVMWHVGTWERGLELNLPPNKLGFWRPKFSRDGKYVLVSESSVRNHRDSAVIDIGKREVIHVAGDLKECIGDCFVRDRCIATITNSGIQIVRLGSQIPILEIALPYYWEINRWALSPDSTVLIAEFESGANSGPKVWSTTTGAPIELQTSYLQWLRPTQFSPDGKRMLYVSGNGIVILAKHRPEEWWGMAWLPEFWGATILFILTVLSVRKDQIKV